MAARCKRRDEAARGLVQNRRIRVLPRNTFSLATGGPNLPKSLSLGIYTLNGVILGHIRDPPIIYVIFLT